MVPEDLSDCRREVSGLTDRRVVGRGISKPTTSSRLWSQNERLTQRLGVPKVLRFFFWPSSLLRPRSRLSVAVKDTTLYMRNDQGSLVRGSVEPSPLPPSHLIRQTRCSDQPHPPSRTDPSRDGNGTGVKGERGLS